MKKLAIITLLACGAYLQAMEYKIPYAAWSFYPKTVNLKLSYKYPDKSYAPHRDTPPPNIYKTTQLGSALDDKYYFYFENLNPDWSVDIKNVPTKTVHQWQTDVAGKRCTQDDFNTRQAQNYGETCLGVIIKIEVIDPTTNQVIMTTPGAWQESIGGKEFIHFVILPDGTMAQVKQIYYDGGIVTRDGYVIRGAFTPQGTVRKEHEQTDISKTKNIPIVTKEGNLGWQD